MNDFLNSRRGTVLTDVTLPDLVGAIVRLAKAVEEQNRLASEAKANPPKPRREPSDPTGPL